MRIDVSGYQERGYVIASGLFSDAEVERYRQHYMDLNRKRRKFKSDPDSFYKDAGDPLKRFPRMIHMHRDDQLSLDWMLHPRLAAAFRQLLGVAPLAVQTMMYFKPPGARGQALHQDQFYLKVQPGTCIAAWMALDDCDEDNGCLQVVPGSHVLPVLCPIEADRSVSFSVDTVPLPAGWHPEPVIMRAGDVLFFNGQLIHGSLPNQSETRFRRALIGHYIDADASKVVRYYHPVLRFDGTVAGIGMSEGGGKCGVWVDRDGNEVLEMTGTLA